MIIFRYLAKEIFIMLSILTAMLLLIFMSNQFVHYLSRAANGQIPGMIVMKLMLLEMPNLLGLLLPLGFYMAIILAYGRLYADSEMIVLKACGYGQKQLLQHSLIMAALIALIVGIIMLWFAPIIAVERAKLLHTTGIKTLVQMLIPGKFNTISNGKHIFYVESMNHQRTQAHNLFYARKEIKNAQPQWNIMWSQYAFMRHNTTINEDYIVLQNGKQYEGIPGKADYQIAKFAQYTARLPHPTIDIDNDIHITKTKNLLPFFNKDRNKIAELQWRLSLPVMVLILTLVAVPLSAINPRNGRFAKLLPAIFIYFLYANFLFVARNWLVSEKIPQWLGLWWLHLVIGLLGIILLLRNRVKLS